MKRLTTCLWFENQAEEAARYYTSTVLTEMIQDEDPEKAERVMAAMLTMRKIDIAALEAAYEGTPAGVGR